MTDQPLDQLRAICLALPEATERETWGEATFRVCEKIFAMAGGPDGGLTMSCKAPTGAQRVLVEANPAAPSALRTCFWHLRWPVAATRLTTTIAYTSCGRTTRTRAPKNTAWSRMPSTNSPTRQSTFSINC